MPTGLREKAMNREAPAAAETLMADEAYARLISALRHARLAAGQFVSMSSLMETLDLPLAPTREAVKRASVEGLVQVLPKRGVMVMGADATATRDCIDLRACS
ncbi:GntR family transcriptional regulator, partial [Amaricoccus sp. HAR-UPW-R2A-40]